MNVAVMQLDMAWENADANLKLVSEWLDSLESGRVDVAVLPELFHSGFSMNATQVAEQGEEKVRPALSQLARRHGIHIVAGVGIVHPSGTALNTALVFDRNGRQTATYVKNRLFPLAGEAEHYQAGSDTVVFDIDGTPCSVFICYDLRFPELFRRVAKQAKVLFVLANWPVSRQLHWQRLLQARAIENQCYVVGVNRTGTDGNGLVHAGGSLVADPLGEITLELRADAECRIISIESNYVDKVRERFPFLDPL